ncbi:MAG: hypothetical protein A3G87_08620 [Omnitrophica bacterium RIFCSPLOWO2_12_FULL_50_11]|nr:MAG: hypothetical protein A3G87_08620 [Omnitrophica bacterium RIFCSPLOWO2_12_FULL_50_11]
MLLFRRIVFYLFLTVFLIGAPLIVFYALGYIYKPGEEKGIVKTGVVYLSSAPPGATIYVGKRRYYEKTPATIRELLAGEYPIKLVLKDYIPWIQSVSVEQGKATVLDKILLRPRKKNMTRLTERRYQRLIPIALTEYLLLERGTALGQMEVYSWEKDVTWPMLPKSVLSKAKVTKVYTEEDSPYAILRAADKGGERYLWTKLSKEREKAQDITDLFVEKPDKIDWPPGQSRYLFSFHGNYLNRLDLDSMTVMPKFAEQIQGYGFSARELYVLQGEDTFARVDFAGKSVKSLMKDSSLFQILFGADDFFSIHVFSDDLILFLGDDGKLVTNRLPYELVERGVLGFDIEKREQRLVIWTQDSLGVIDFSSDVKRGDIFQRGPQLRWVYKEGRDIKDAFWVYQDAYILFQDRNDVFLLELETLGNPNLYELLAVKKHAPVHYVEKTGRLYYLDEKSGRLASLEVVPKQALIDIPLPRTEEERKEKKVQGL